MTAGVFVNAAEFEVPDALSRVLILWVLIVPVLAFFWIIRERTTQREVSRLVKVAGLPDPRPLWPAVTDAIRVRVGGRVLGTGVALLVLGSLLAWSGVGGAWLALCAAPGAAIGMGLAHLPRALTGVGPRTASLRRREFGDYLPPRSRMLWRAAPAWPVMALGTAAVMVSAGEGMPSGWVSVAVQFALAIVAFVAMAVAARRVLDAPLPELEDEPRAWHEVLRAHSLRDLVGGGGALLATASALVVFWVAQQPQMPQWSQPLWIVFAVAAASYVLILMSADIDDASFRWAQEHALASETG